MQNKIAKGNGSCLFKKVALGTIVTSQPTDSKDQRRNECLRLEKLYQVMQWQSSIEKFNKVREGKLVISDDLLALKGKDGRWYMPIHDFIKMVNLWVKALPINGKMEARDGCVVCHPVSLYDSLVEKSNLTTCDKEIKTVKFISHLSSTIRESLKASSPRKEWERRNHMPMLKDPSYTDPLDPDPTSKMIPQSYWKVTRSFYDAEQLD